MSELLKRYRPTQRFYHLSHPDNISEIEKDGLHADEDGLIFMITDMIAADSIAINQIFCSRYALFEILPAGLTGDMFQDDMEADTAPYAVMVKQSRIDPKYLLYLGTHEIRTDPAKPLFYSFFGRRGIDRKEIEEMISIIRDHAKSLATPDDLGPEASADT